MLSLSSPLKSGSLFPLGSPLSVRNYGVEPSTAGLGTGLYIILGILHHLTALHDESLVQVWIIDGRLLPVITAAAGEVVKVEEEGGEEDTQHEDWESGGKRVEEEGG